ncbi:MAG: YeeE/YedE family protein, partial [Thermoplasmatales archaeon]
MSENEIDLTKEKTYDRDRKIFWKTVYALLSLAIAFLLTGIIMQTVFHQTKAPLWLGLLVALPLAIPLELWNFTDPDTLWRVMAFQDRF